MYTLSKLSNSKRTLICIFLFFSIWIFGTLLIYSKYSLYVDVLENIKWSHHLATVYEKHPGLGALLMKIVLFFTSNPLLAGLICSSICMLIGIIYLYRLLSLYFDKDTTLFLVILSLMSGVFGDYSFVQYNQNVILLPFWVMTCYYFALVCQNNILKNWILLTLSAALGVYSKFEIGLLLITLFIFLLTKLNKKMFKNLIISLAIFIVLLIPLFIGLVQTKLHSIIYAIG